METTVITGSGGESYVARELAEDGIAALEAKDYARCVERLDLLFKHFEASPYHYPSLYNRGLCHEAAETHLKAAESFALYVKEAMRRDRRREQLDGRVRLGINLIKGGRPEPARRIFDLLLSREFILGADRAECHLRRAQSQRALGAHERALTDIDLAIGNLQSSGLVDEERVLVTEIHFERGETFRGLAERIVLKMPVAQMKRDLADKMKLFRKAMHSYLSAVRNQEPYWSTAAGNRLGTLYENFYTQVMRAEYPSDFNQETVKFYLITLKKRLVPMLQEALSLYERTLSMSARLGAENQWVQATKESADRLRVMVLEVQRELDEAAQGEMKEEPSSAQRSSAEGS